MPALSSRPCALAGAVAALGLLVLSACSGAASPATPPPSTARGAVGPGWSAVSFTTRPGTGPDRADPVGPYTVDLVSPSGQRWTVGHSDDHVDLQAVTPDGGHVLALRRNGSTTVGVELDTRTGTWRDVTTAQGAAEGAVVLAYTRPSGRQIWVDEASDDPSGSTTVLRLDRSGRVTLRLTGVDGEGVVPTPDGMLFATGGPGGALQVHDNATGSVLRTLGPPPGHEDCTATGGWSGSALVASCSLDAGGGSTDVLLLDAATGSWTPLTHALPGMHDGIMGYSTAFPVPGGVLAVGQPGCGAGPSGLLDADGRVHRWLAWPGADGPVAIVGVVGATAYAEETECGSPVRGLVAQDVRTHRTTTLLSAPWLSAVVVQDR